MPGVVDASIDKLIVTNGAALRDKYGAGGLSRLRRALRVMRDADATRGVRTVVVDLSSRRTYSPIGLDPVADPGDHGAVLRLVDAVCELAVPDYLLLLGGPDIVPHVPLVNPMPAPDPDPDVPSDLPYACPGGPTDAASLVAATRVVGRLPDTIGVSDSAAAQDFAAAIRRAARWSTTPSDTYRAHLALSTARWQLSTAATALALFGTSEAIVLAPEAAAPWSAEPLGRRVQWMNLHGSAADSRWLGDPGFGVSISSDDIRAGTTSGTVAVVECCFGGELFDPALSGGALPFPLAYLAAGAVAVVGPSCISYGGRTAPDAADLLCRYFLESLLAGASTGRALLTARQRYIAEQPVMTPVDLKTIAQFGLIGDPSCHPVATPEALAAATATRAGRRIALRSTGEELADSTAVAAGTGRAIPGAVADEMRRSRSLPSPTRGARTFEVASRARVAADLPAQRVHITGRRLAGPVGLAVTEIVETAEAAGALRPYRTVESKHGH